MQHSKFRLADVELREVKRPSSLYNEAAVIDRHLHPESAILQWFAQIRPLFRQSNGPQFRAFASHRRLHAKVCNKSQHTEHDCKQASKHSSGWAAPCEAQCGGEGQQGGRQARRRQPPGRDGPRQDRIRHRHQRLQHLRRRRAPQGAESAALCGGS